jgi:hypothetical protein
VLCRTIVSVLVVACCDRSALYYLAGWPSLEISINIFCPLALWLPTALTRASDLICRAYMLHMCEYATAAVAERSEWFDVKVAFRCIYCTIQFTLWQCVHVLHTALCRCAGCELYQRLDARVCMVKALNTPGWLCRHRHPQPRVGHSVCELNHSFMWCTCPPWPHSRQKHDKPRAANKPINSCNLINASLCVCVCVP